MVNSSYTLTVSICSTDHSYFLTQPTRAGGTISHRGHYRCVTTADVWTGRNIKRQYPLYPPIRPRISAQSSLAKLRIQHARRSNVHAQLAARCLSYLAYNVAKGPLATLSLHIRPILSPVRSSGASQRTSESNDSGCRT
jgi:hypothetical protein